MTKEKKKEKEQKALVKKLERKRKKKNALIMCHDGREFWTTQAEFWQWVREQVVVKVSDAPLRGQFIRRNEEYNVVLGNTVLNLKCPNHLREVLISRRRALQ
jgi:hypothetical protein